MDGIANITPNIATRIRRCLPPTRAPVFTSALLSNSTCWKSLPRAYSRCCLRSGPTGLMAVRVPTIPV